MTARRIKFSAAYAVAAVELSRTITMEVPDDLDEDGLRDLLYEETGFGPEYANLNAGYSAESVDDLQPEIDEEWY